ncbi:hypothetical protein SPIROBIBN47_410020 [uncultured spirochete]|uniref:Uncharacterized protein n=1 Tax=uncultured spirochete TaxID=156406 RepID=A0A3P3XL73_9SPIR|nr:hypothetical protein SPIROBIBN47_410020 [uncultured spirochete]
MSIGKDLDEIAAELMRLDYGELHIVVRGGEIVSYSIIRSKLVLKRNEKEHKQLQEKQY